MEENDVGIRSAGGGFLGNLIDHAGELGLASQAVEAQMDDRFRAGQPRGRVEKHRNALGARRDFDRMGGVGRDEERIAGRKAPQGAVDLDAPMPAGEPEQAWDEVAAR